MTDKREYSPDENAAGADLPADEVLAEFIRRRDAGEQVDVESLCAARPDLADALRSYADGEAMFREMAADDSVAGASALAETVRPGAGRDTDASMTGRSFGNYRIVRQLGQGGMGAVYLAEDTTLQRHVALKIPRFTAADGPDARERFFREARSAAALTHPHICPVYFADEMDGTPFIAMAFVDGQPLSRSVGTPEFRDQRRVAELIRLVADALQHAHDQGFIHRDLKPGNIMLDREEKPVVTDFGLARRLVPDQESRITQEGQLVGTPAYMSPEQIAGKSEKISSSTDIYALGVVMFELLACRLPFQGSVPEVIAGALKSEPPKLSSLRPDVSLDLQALSLQMLQKEPEQRPKSMRDVADRLQKWLANSSPESTAQRAAAQNVKDELIAERQRIEKSLRAGKFEAALKRLKALAHRKEPEAAEFREWAIDQIPRVKARPAEAKRNEPEMLKMAQEWMTKHDYAQAIQILRSVPDVYRSEKAEDLLQEATDLQTEADDLLLDLKHCVKERIYDGIDDNLKRLLELKPGNQFAKNLHQKLQGYRGGRGKGRPYRFDNKGRLLAVNEDNFWSRAMILSAVVGAVVFGLMTWGITIYLKSGDRTVAVEIDPAWLQEQGANLTLNVDGDEHTLSSPELNLTISVGEHGFAVRDNGRLIHNPQTFTIEDDGRQVLHIDARGMNLAVRGASTNTSKNSGQNKGNQLPPNATPVASNRRDGPSQTSLPAASSPFDAEQAKAYQESWARHLGVPVEFTDRLGFTFRLIPPGDFLMGTSDEGIHARMEHVEDDEWWKACLLSEAPQHHVAITKPFYLSTTEVTQNQFESIMSWNPSRFAPENNADLAGESTLKCPVEHITWTETQEFIDRLNSRAGASHNETSRSFYRLPTEAEWEFACRGGTTTTFWTGDDAELLKEKENFGNRFDRIMNVGALAANPFGLYDMSGNVHEYVQDRWDARHYIALNGAVTIDPAGATDKDLVSRVVRGGDYWWWNYHSRSSYRIAIEEEVRSGMTIGFRVAGDIDSVHLANQPKSNEPSVTDFSEIHGATKDELQAWLESLRGQYVPLRINLRWGATEDLFDAVAVNDSDAGIWQVSFFDDDRGAGRDFKNMRGTHRDIFWKLLFPRPDTPPHECPGLKIWRKTDRKYFTWNLGNKSLVDAANELRRDGWLPMSLAYTESGGDRNNAIVRHRLPGIGNQSFVGLDVSELAQKADEFRSRNWRLHFFQLQTGTSAPRVSCTFRENIDAHDWELSFDLTEALYRQQLISRRRDGWFPACVGSYVLAGETQYLVSWEK